MTMSDGVAAAASTKATTPASEADGATTDRRLGLREVAKQLESLFLKQLFQAMRESAPEGSTATQRTSNDFFGGMMDEHMADEASANASTSLGKALYRQLVGMTHPRPTSTPVPETGEASK